MEAFQNWWDLAQCITHKHSPAIKKNKDLMIKKEKSVVMLFTINVIMCEKPEVTLTFWYFRKGCCKPQSTVCSSVPPSVCLSVWLSVTCSVSLPRSVFPRICQLVCVSDHFSPRLTTYPSVWPSACISLCTYMPIGSWLIERSPLRLKFEVVEMLHLV